MHTEKRARGVFSARFDGDFKIDGTIFETFTIASRKMSFIDAGDLNDGVAPDGFRLSPDRRSERYTGKLLFHANDRD